MNFGLTETSKNILLIGIILFITSCGRTPSAERFEQATDISIPNDVEVLKDEYQDMLQDYAIYYTIKLTPEQCNLTTESIKSSEFFQNTDNESSNWSQTNSGYEFTNGSKSKTSFSASLDSTTYIMEFIEIAD